jgi:hypothetical protein
MSSKMFKLEARRIQMKRKFDPEIDGKLAYLLTNTLGFQRISWATSEVRAGN